MLEFIGLGSILVVVLLFVALVVVASTVKIVPQGYNYTVENFGRYVRTLTPGLNLITPFVERIGHKMNMMEQVLDVPTQEVITRDNASVAADGVAFYQVLDASAAAYEVSNLQYAVLNLVMTNLRSVMGSMDLDDLLSNRDTISERILRVVDQAAHSWGIKITRIEIKDINPPKNLVDSMARQMMAEREKRAEILEAEGKRNAQILKAEGQKQAQILEAEGKREAAFREAEARERLAEAEAKATRLVSEAIASGDVQAINYFVAQRYTDALAKIASAPNQRVVLMPLEASSLIGAIGGIAEIARATFPETGGRAPPAALRTPPATVPRTPSFAVPAQGD
ncbi:SPFH domain-containing protein [Aureimonas jatrophae]|uniref:Regulator of protease activity HflC, stomatin/prohibitin superfamily n=1 Tax=Aureimonas jatrophae TaxID=1166073 RepID=A0A1H0IR39_9HYPH|nr:SPFH domain-containing protein [Aureimonas jatrophae]MBB3952317.1 regulator of protease activity HflC (stomatin/prohibitin superfamily) [Aureimonas jatrophae]SDO33896.1 Regulator of protease activity HflC, stomatin/prohibitin superfamily [Aureimonas jatrophae]